MAATINNNVRRTAAHVERAEWLSQVTHLEECADAVHRGRAAVAIAKTDSERDEAKFQMWAELHNLEGEDVADTISEAIFPEVELAVAA